MREIVIRYTFKHVDTGNIETKRYSLSQLEEKLTKDLSPCFNVGFGYELIGRDEYTGLKDKNGTEIYEGDILKVYEVSNRRDLEYTSPVEYIESGFLVTEPNDTQVPLACFHDNENAISPLFEIEVIGNIYENLELLNKQSTEAHHETELVGEIHG